MLLELNASANSLTVNLQREQYQNGNKHHLSLCQGELGQVGAL